MDWVSEVRRNSALTEIERYECHEDNAYWAAVLTVHTESNIHRSFVDFLDTDATFKEALPEILYDCQINDQKIPLPINLYQHSSLAVESGAFSEMRSVLLGKKQLKEYGLDFQATQVIVSMVTAHSRVGVLSPKQFPYFLKVLHKQVIPKDPGKKSWR